MTKNAEPNLEQKIEETNAGFFLKEFAISKTKFSLPSQTEVELADHIISIDESLVVFQLKQRSEDSNDAAQETKWYENKILKKAKKQICDTVQYIQQSEIKLKNDRGHLVTIPQSIDPLKIIVYESSPAMPENLLRKKGMESSNAGFIHLLNIQDYLNLLNTLVTLPEILDYFSYREVLCRKFSLECNSITEKALVGHFVCGDTSIVPSEDDSINLRMLDDPNTFQIFFILQQLKEKSYAMTASSGHDHETRYYKVLKELLYLGRNQLAEFKKRFMWAWDQCGAESIRPSRFADVERGCGFVFIPIAKGEEGRAEGLLSMYTMMAHYDYKIMGRCLGISFRRDNEFRLLDWMHYEAKWRYDSEADRIVREANLFRPAKAVQKPHY